MITPRRLTFVCAIAATVLMFGGCGKQPVGPYSSKPGSNMPEGKAIDYSNGRGTITEELGPSEESLDAAANGANVGSLGFSGDMNSDEYKQIYGRSSSQMQPVYFDFDQATIRGDQIPRIEHNAEYLRANPAQNVVIEGNCDDRGTNEYNLALGERRAQNAKNYLVELGIEEYRIRTVSYGEERPLFSGQTDADLSHNRRDDFILE